MSKKLNAIKSLKKSTFASARLLTEPKTLKGVTQHVTKMTLVVVNAGIEYNNQKSVITKRSDGRLPSKPQPLPWGEWYAYPYGIINKETKYLRLYIKGRPRVLYFIDGKRSTKAEAQKLCRAFDSYEYKLTLATVAKSILTVSSAKKAKNIVARFGGKFVKVVKLSKPDAITPKESSLVSLRQKGKELLA
tara:strand:+ start:268 stop:837 length:570 start_codon:yes stop_codon:yes gene_type:complete